jgi:hypothetical protein
MKTTYLLILQLPHLTVNQWGKLHGYCCIASCATIKWYQNDCTVLYSAIKSAGVTHTRCEMQITDVQILCLILDFECIDLIWWQYIMWQMAI